jgi:hypothetical protein
VVAAGVYNADFDVAATRTAHRLRPADFAAAPRRAHLCASARFGSSARTARAMDGRATSGRSAQRSRVRASTGFDAVSLRASPSHLPGLGPPHRPCYGHMPCYAKGPLSSGKGLDLHKLVAGEGFEPSTSGL